MSPDKQLDSIHDLTVGQRDGLRQHGLSPEAFDRMPPLEQHEWLEELKTDSYQGARRDKRI